MIWWPFNIAEDLYKSLNWRNSPMIWWPFNTAPSNRCYLSSGVTHQWSGDLSMYLPIKQRFSRRRNSPMIWWPFNTCEFVQPCYSDRRNSPMIWWPFNAGVQSATTNLLWRNSPMIWWPFNDGENVAVVQTYGVTHQWSGDLSINNPNCG